MNIGWVVMLLLPVTALITAAHLYTIRTYHRFRRITAESGLTGGRMARELLDRHGLSGVGVQEAQGLLSDRYDLLTHTIRLSKENFRSTSIAALGIAAHEIGHAQQHVNKAQWMTLRHVLLLVKTAGWIALLAFLCVFIGLLSNWMDMVLIGLLLFAGAVLCSLLTLPVELNASRRALALLRSGGYLTGVEMEGARAVLRAAAWGYTATAGIALIQAIRYFLKRDDE